MKWIGLLLLSVLPAFSGLAAEPRVFKIALVLPLSGTAGTGQEERQAIQLALEDDAALGPLCENCRLETVDLVDPVDAAESARLAGHLAADPDLIGVIGHRHASAVAAAAVYAEHGLPLLSPYCTDPGLTSRGFNQVFRLSSRDDQQGRAAAKFALSVGRKRKVLILHDGSPYGETLARAFRDGIRLKGVRELGYMKVEEKDASDPVFINRLKGFGPNLVYFGGGPVLAAKVAAGMVAAGVQFSLFGGDQLYGPAFLKEAGPAAEGSLISYLVPDFRKVRTREYMAFKKRYRARFGAPGQMGPFAYEAARLMLKALRTAGPPQRESLRRSLAALPPTRGLAGKVSFDARGDNTGQKVHFYVAHLNSVSKKIGFVYYPQE